MAEKYVGKRQKRTEDPRLIQGLAHYVDDIKLPDTLHAIFLRSMYAHARIKSVDTGAAAKVPGVVAIYTGKDVSAKIGPVPRAACWPAIIPASRNSRCGRPPRFLTWRARRSRSCWACRKTSCA